MLPHLDEKGSRGELGLLGGVTFHFSSRKTLSFHGKTGLEGVRATWMLKEPLVALKVSLGRPEMNIWGGIEIQGVHEGHQSRLGLK